MASYLHDVSDSLDSGGGVSGPAARRLADAARHAASPVRGAVPVTPAGPRPARRPRAPGPRQPAGVPGLQLRPGQGAVPPRPEAGSTAGHPALDRCNPACANIARTDEHITALTAEIARLRAESASPLLPGPIRQRLAGRAAALEKIAERHARTRITPGDDDARR